MPSLQDQLLKSGLTDEKKARAARSEKKKQKKQNKQQPQAAEPQAETRERARKQREEQAERDRQLNREREEAAREKAALARIRQLVNTHALPRKGAETSYQFVHGTRVRKLWVTSAMVDQLARGQLAIACIDQGYEVIPASTARQIQEEDSETVVVLHEPGKGDDSGDDPYAGFEIPDDLMW